MLRRVGRGVATASAGVVGVVVFAAIDASQQRISDGHDVKSAASQYLLHRVMTIMGWWGRRQLEVDCGNVAACQEKFLLTLLRDNQDTEYGRRSGFESLMSSSDFRRTQPLTTFPHYADYVERLKQSAEPNLLTRETVSRLGVTSGTSGTACCLPVVPEQRRIFFTQGITVVFNVISTSFHGFQSSMQRTLKLFYTPTPRMTPGGLTMGPNSSAPQDSKSLLDLYTTPPACYDVMTEPEALYLYTLFALKDRNLGVIESNFVASVEHFFRSLRRDLPQLAADIRSGTVRPDLNIPDHVRASLGPSLKPDPARAAELEAAFASSGGRPPARALWPHLHFILAVATGSMEVGLPPIRCEAAVR